MGISLDDKFKNYEYDFHMYAPPCVFVGYQAGFYSIEECLEKLRRGGFVDGRATTSELKKALEILGYRREKEDD